MLGNQELNLAADVWAQSASLISPWLGWVLQIQQVKQKQSYFSILFGSITFIPSLFRAEQGVPSPPPPFFFIFIFFCPYSPAAWAGQREGFGLGCVQHTYLPRALPTEGALPTRPDPAQGPEQTVRKTAFTKAKPAE